MTRGADQLGVVTESGGEAQGKMGRPVAGVRGGPPGVEPQDASVQTEQRRGENSDLGFGQPEPGQSQELGHRRGEGGGSGQSGIRLSPETPADLSE